jgi:hypothetical protein
MHPFEWSFFRYWRIFKAYGQGRYPADVPKEQLDRYNFVVRRLNNISYMNGYMLTSQSGPVYLPYGRKDRKAQAQT